ncbi:uncharacterized protein SPSK_03622 [Sporothrix schenckii 1099-18]|uniref:Mitochondrial pyruvate carrier n=2 Tax=Sporothrix schenckii TaxID=29908 RepID=U7PX73_SPOS1|nr:uncharacterized protein SPSK_03622 [Sporothrix schenckii 1099-18]ERS99521.1 hypothetical protein HMPREF1624_04723 [Sporothrix schenckii ATCC 58251]KJR82740.1 hypothetical protein SPSK_03622 [Sporothrix schenckii 1099-18]
MSSSATFARVAARPFASATFFSANTPTASSMIVRRIATGSRPASKTIPRFSSASFFAAAFRRGTNNTKSSNFYGRRFQSGAAGAGAAEANVSWFKRMWDSPIGLKTVHFWAPIMKWALVIAGISDLARPAEKLSVTQNVALTATGLIWTRWCLIIKPRNIMLAAANFFLGVAGMVQCARIYLARASGKTAEPLADAVKDKVESV